ncbi:MFS transporter [Paraburkholderia silvatlantica]|uniref:DHA1 family multidrug resistance protein-like MFS transporter n=1 Tax=Paraburkholderia silvatlantica TaxID=321895 RepID=A0A2U1AII3_9BURK|nr:MFS transporter [Paraburkholderia silvatlantica]MBB2927489.1 DHA1 family multidrug resistance protein-like MFS transporter [Paraburkholderia silvatlantica]PVY36203.1 DHA1 family multidrug resistance protein-like MFS transporter [Paraburkholderia silvatlantica]PXW40381.1 DHA1 family multidrug resistance protein-like MFS transporter [Paraburkholderia silvatlantica]PYE24350.1 DHA1 family multidrug resistance protein-like MFS transporter [Paraburkholderia silvatlantica]TDQ97547.1 DHA1 family mu
MNTTLSSPAAAPRQTKPPPRGYAERNAHYWRRNLVVCVIGSFTTLVSLSMLLPFLPLYVRQLGVTSQSAVIQWSGVAFGATFLGTALTAPIWGRLADRYGRKPMLVRAAIGMAVVMSLIGVAHNVYELVALRLIAGLVGGYASASTVMVGTQAPRERAGWALGILSTGALAGNLVGPLVGGVLPGWIGIRGTFFAGGAMIAVAALLTIFVVKEEFHPESDAKSHARHAAAGSGSGVRRPDYAVVSALLVTAMMVLLANMSIEPVITVYIGSLGVGAAHLARVAGVVMACSALGSMLTAARLGALADRFGSWRVIVACLVLTGLAMVPQAFVAHWWQLAGLRVVMGMTLAGLLPSIGKLARQSVDESKTGRMLGYLQSAQFSGQVVGPVIGGVIGVHFGLHAVFFATGALLVACGGLAHWAQRRAHA